MNCPPMMRAGTHAGRNRYVAEATITVIFLVIVTVATAAAQGGYFPTSWGWTTLAFVLGIEAWLVLRGRTDAGRADLAFLIAFILFGAWVAASILWSVNAAQSIQDMERVLVLVVGATAFVVLVHRALVSHVTLVLVAGMTAVAGYGLLTRLFPSRLGSYDPVAVYRLSEPIGYWNGLGVFCAMGLTLALGLVARDGTHVGARIVAGIALVVFPVTLYFTFSRGGTVAAAAAVAAVAILSPRRLRLAGTLLATAPTMGLAVILASRSEALTHRFSALSNVSAAGNRLALLLALLCLVQVVVAVTFGLVAHRLELRASTLRVTGALLVIGLVAVLVTGIARFGSPVSVADRAYHSFVAPAPATDPVDLNRRLISFGGNGRIDIWRYAWQEVKRHPLLGTGAGSFERDWQANPNPPFKLRDAHALYLETLAELGPVGLVLLVVALLIPLAVGLTARRQPLVPYLAGAYVAFLVHAGVDWDWELGGVSLTALLIGALLLASTRGDERQIRDRIRAPAMLLAVGVGAIAAVGLLGNQAIAKAEAANEGHRYAEAEQRAVNARQLMPWSSRPWIVLGEAQFASGDRQGALASFRRAVDIDSREWTGWIDLAVAAHGQERLRALANAKKLYPGSEERRKVVEELAKSRGS